MTGIIYISLDFIDISKTLATVSSRRQRNLAKYKLDVQMFDGRSGQWSSFWDKFTNTVHKQTASRKRGQVLVPMSTYYLEGF